MKLIIDIPDVIYNMVCNTGTFGCYRFNTAKEIKNGIPLDDLKAEIETAIERTPIDNDFAICKRVGLTTALEILDRIGEESEE